MGTDRVLRSQRIAAGTTPENAASPPSDPLPSRRRRQLHKRQDLVRDSDDDEKPIAKAFNSPETEPSSNVAATPSVPSLGPSNLTTAASLPTPLSILPRKRKLTALNDDDPPAGPSPSPVTLALSTGQLGHATPRSSVRFYENKVAEALSGFTFEDGASPAGPVAIPSDNIEEPFAFVYTHLSVRPDRHYQAEVIGKPSHGKPTAKHHRPATWQLQARQGEIVREFLCLKKAGFSEQEAMAICHKFVDALIRWPDEDAISHLSGSFRAGGIPRPLVRAIFGAAQHQALPAKPLRFFAPRTKKERLMGMLYYIDPETFEARRHDFSFAPDNISSTTPIPVTPEMESILFSPLSTLVKPVESTYLMDLSNVPENERDGCRQAERLVQMCCAVWLRTKSLLKTSVQVQAFLDEMLRRFVSDKRAVTLNGFDNARLWITGRKGILFRRIEPSKKVQAVADGLDWPTMVLQSADFAWMKIVGQAATAKWLETRDVRLTWIALAQATDEVNARILAGENSPGFCSCDDGFRASHPCGMCGAETPCESLEPHRLGLRVCPRYHTRFQTRTTSAAQKLTRLSLSYSLMGDEAQYPEDVPSAILRDIKLGNEAWIEGTFKQEDGMAYINEYSGRWLQPPPQSRHPGKLSIDAVFPFTRHHSGRVFSHTADNIAATTIALNYLKGTQLPMLLSKVSTYYSEYLALRPLVLAGLVQETAQLAQLRKRLIADCRDLTAIRQKVPFRTKDRFALQLSPEQLEYFKEEWISGKLHPGTPTPGSVPYYQGSGSVKFPFSEWQQQQPTIMKIVGEIEDFTGIRLPRQNGCPYFAHPDSMPSNWGWQTCFRLMIFRLRVMVEWCNRFCVTVETPITVFIECIFQVCIGVMVVKVGDPDAKAKKMLQSKYTEFLGLPLDIQQGSPLQLAIGHRVHGRQMRTGWPQQPTQLRDRIDEDNNILVETRSSNYFKSDFHESFYPTLKAQLLSVDIPRQWADSSISPRPFNARMEQLNVGLGEDSRVSRFSEDEWEAMKMDDDILGDEQEFEEEGDDNDLE